MSITERVHKFGDRGSLGIVTLPPGDNGKPVVPFASRPFVVILNAGLVHRVGPFRMSVDLARRLAVRGSRVLRFDLSGIGDSPARATYGLGPQCEARGRSAPVEEQAVEACKEAMNFLAERYGADKFTVGGLCTGAMNAHRMGLVDHRVEGIWLLDGYAYPTLHSQARRIAHSVRRPQRLLSMGRRLATGGAERLGSILWGDVTPAKDDPPTEETRDSRRALFFQSWPPVKSVRADLERMLNRGARFLFVYTGGWSGFRHRDQFDGMFPSLPNRHLITVDFHPNADHTFLALSDRKALFQSVELFVTSGRGS